MTPKRVDQNQREIVEALRAVGAAVQILSDVGHGCPDLLVGYGRSHTNYLLEVKMPGAPLTADEIRWHQNWPGQIAVVHSPEEALMIIRFKQPFGGARKRRGAEALSDEEMGLD